MRRPVESTQYLSIRYTERLADAGIEPSVGSRGDSYDNPLAKSVIGLYKTELIRRRGPWRSLEDVELATLEWVWWFNYHRLLEPIGYLPPVEHEENHYLHHETHPEGGTQVRSSPINPGRFSEWDVVYLGGLWTLFPAPTSNADEGEGGAAVLAEPAEEARPVPAPRPRVKRPGQHPTHRPRSGIRVRRAKRTTQPPT